MEKGFKDLGFKEKVNFFRDLMKHYSTKEGEYYYKKFLVIELFFRGVEKTFDSLEVKRDLTNGEMEDILFTIFSPAYIEELNSKWTEEGKLALETWIGCIYWILQWDRDVYYEELKELGKI